VASQRIIPGDCIQGLRTLPDASVHCCVTSPPYWGLRDYGHAGQIGLEATPEAYVARMVEVFREVRRVLREDGTCWVNLGDSYASGGGQASPHRDSCGGIGKKGTRGTQPYHSAGGGFERPASITGAIKPNDLCGIPWRVAFALQADGWWLRQDIIWHKPNPMPESVRDRCTKAHEYVFLMTKSERYFYDAEAVSEATMESSLARSAAGFVTTDRDKQTEGVQIGAAKRQRYGLREAFVAKPTRNRRSVWTVTTKPYSGAHFAVMPAALVEPCIKAGCPEGGTVLDPFAGSGTTLAVAAELGRSGIGCELNPDYVTLAYERIAKARGKAPLFS
jgi:DNA modification methylase